MATYDYKPPDFTYGVIEHVGRNYGIGLLFSAPYNFYKGSTAMPSGSRFIGGVHRACKVAPQSAGSLAAWTSVYAATWGALAHFRGKEDPWNAIIGAATAGGVESLRRGFGPVSVSFVVAGLVVGVLEVVHIGVERFVAQKEHDKQGERYIKILRGCS